ncbi:MAG: ACP S-malonyltransferase [Hyphomicrobiales bacterium]|nr:ACP S-malonyltransferase [Hyphomicrobiales bacterium]
MKTAFIFPGQGSQHLGMGRDLAAAHPEAKAVFDEVDEALGRKLTAVMWGESEAELTLTENAQPALMAVSLAAMRVIEAAFGFRIADRVSYVAGHSLGEYSALAAAGSIGVADAARLLDIRGRAMQNAAPVGSGAMAALLGADFESAEKLAAIAAEGQVCQAANDNAVGQVVISGHREAVERAVAMSKDYGVRRAMMLSVSAPFHSALMAPAAEAMARALAETAIAAPAVPLIANVLARPISDPKDIRTRLVEQVTGAVRWRETMDFMIADGVTVIAEIGAGKVLSGLARRASPDLTTVNVGAPQDLDAFGKTFSA